MDGDNDEFDMCNDHYNHMADEHSGVYEDEYDRYEDYVTETGHDPYGLFSDAFDVARTERLLTRIRRVSERVAKLIFALRRIGRSVDVDDIPF